jgi:predicted permease
MTILSTILPIFFVILLGWAFHRMGFIPQTFLGPGNRLVFYLAIPAMIFRSIAKATITTQFDIRVVLVTLMESAGWRFPCAQPATGFNRGRTSYQ